MPMSSFFRREKVIKKAKREKRMNSNAWIFEREFIKQDT